MKIIPSKLITLDSTNIPSDGYPTWDSTLGYLKGTVTNYNSNNYVSLKDIGKTCHYTYNIYTKIAIDVQTGLEVDSTAIDCTLNETVVFTPDDNGYYVFSSTQGLTQNGNGTYTVDFDLETVTSPEHFTLLYLEINELITDFEDRYRHEVEYPDLNPLSWNDLGFENSHKFLDTSISTQTINESGNIEFTFTTSKIDTIAFFNVTAASINVTVLDDAVETYNETHELTTRIVNGWFDYFFANFIFKDSLVIPDLPIGFDQEVTVTVNGANTGLGMCVIGKSEFIGDSIYGASVTNRDYSEKTADAEGNIYLKQGVFARKNTAKIQIPTASFDNVVTRLDMLRAIPTLYSIADGFSTLHIFGYYQNYDTIMQNQNTSKLSVKLESLT